MEQTITAKPNQSIPDLVLMAYGSLEAGMDMMYANGQPIGTVPDVGSNWITPDVESTKMNAEAVMYFKQRGIVIGTAYIPVDDGDSDGGTDDEALVVLKPVMQAVPAIAGDPNVTGYYLYDVVATADFIHIHPLAESYGTDNPVNFQTIDGYVIAPPYSSVSAFAVTPMPAMSVPYKIVRAGGGGYMIVWTDPDQPVKTITYADTMGNTAFVAPLIVLDSMSQAVMAYLLADLAVEKISETPAFVKVRVTRSHAAVALPEFATLSLGWYEEAALGAPDPADLANHDKTILTLGPGNHTIGVKAVYHYSPDIVFPESIFTMVIRGV